MTAISHYGARHPEHAHAALRQARQHAPVVLGPYGPEVLSYELVRAVLRDPRFAMPRGMGLAAQGITDGPVWERVCRSIVSLDGAEHLRLRRLVSRAFTPRAAHRMRSACADVITELVNCAASAGGCDVVTDIARPYPVPIICALLGIPRDDWPLFSHWVRGIGKTFGPRVGDHLPAIEAAWEGLEAYMADVIARRRQSLSDDLISELLRAEDDGQSLTRAELVELVAILLVAGTDTTRNQLAAAVQAFCDYPEQWTLLREHPELAPRAVEEIMRHSPASFSAVRNAVDDVELGGVPIAAGTIVVLNTAAANRDPAAYDDPDRLDITRARIPPMLTLGGGAHTCLGAHLAKVELAEALVVMTQRMPRIRRTGPAPWKPIVGISGPTTLPIEFDSDATPHPRHRIDS